MKKILFKIEMLKYETSILDIDKEQLTGVNARLQELENLVKEFDSKSNVIGQSGLLKCNCGNDKNNGSSHCEECIEDSFFH